MILIALGANLPGRFASPDAALAAACDEMQKRGLKITAQSKNYLTKPVPASDQPDYHNAVVAVEADLSPFALLELLQSIENDLGRVRSVRNAARIIDLDLIAYNGVVIDKPELIVPHPRAHERLFVLEPLRDIAPDWVHPISKKTVTDLIAGLHDR